jgi:hypothetical protein
VAAFVLQTGLLDGSDTMTTQDLERVRFHLNVPVCRTRHGCLTHLRLAPMGDLSLLCRFFGCNAGEVGDAFWAAIKNRKETMWRLSLKEPEEGTTRQWDGLA